MEKSISDRTRLLAFFAALCLFLSAIEYAIPKPLPFLRLGLANLPILLSLEKFSRRETVFLALAKIFLQSVISGTLFSYLVIFSLCGTMASTFAMILIQQIFGKTGLVSKVGISLAGSAANSTALLILSKFILFGKNTAFVAPFLLISSCVTGLFLGIFAEKFAKNSSFYKNLENFHA